MKEYKRIFVLVIDSVGIGYMNDAHLYGDEGSNTLKHISEATGGINIPVMEKLGIGCLDNLVGVKPTLSENAFVARLNETSKGKDTMTGHWEMMGINTTKPFQTFTDTGFPQALIDELEEKTGHKVIGNYAASGTEILKELGEEQTRDNSLIVYTSSDSVLQIACNTATTPLEELYRCCDIAREICMKPEYFVGRIIARPFTGTNASNFARDGANRHDIAVSPSGVTAMDILKENELDVVCVGKIFDIFNGEGVTETHKIKNNQDGMDKTIAIAKDKDFKGMCFINLVEFDSEFGHRRNPEGYKLCLEQFDERLGELINVLKDDDLLIVCADHGNDPTWPGTDHTREKVPFIAYSKSIDNGCLLEERDSFADIGITVLKNFKLNPDKDMIGKPIKELL